MSNIQAAIGCAQMERVETLVTRKREILKTYKQAFEGIPEIKMNPEFPDTINGAWMPSVVFDATKQISREQLQKAFMHENIDARVFFSPLSSLPMFKRIYKNTNAWSIPCRAINLPSYHDMSDQDIGRIINLIQALTY